MTYSYRNFRLTQAYFTPQESAPDAWVDATIDYQAGVNQFGMFLTNPAATDRTLAGTIHTAGNLTLGSPSDQFIQAMPSGNYRFKLALSAAGVTNTQSVCIWDGACADGATPTTTGNTVTIAPSGGVIYPDGVPIGTNKYAIIEGRLYHTAIAGTTNAANKPVHESGTVSDGTIQWRFVKKALVWAYNAAVAGGSTVMDATGATHILASWLANNIASPEKVVTQGFVTVTRTSEGQATLRSFGFELQSTPLAPVTLLDEKGVAMGAAPLLYAAQPAGKVCARLIFAAGSTANITLGGNLAPYFTVEAGAPPLLRASSTPMPDSVAALNDRTLQIIQTDAGAQITGSPYTTTFAEAGGTLNIVSSQGKPTSLVDGSGNPKVGYELAIAKISTQSWLRHKLVKEMNEASWPGHTGQAFAHSRPVTTDAELTSALTAAAGAIGVGVWQEIVLNGGTYSSLRVMPTANFSQGGTGGLLIRKGAGTHVITNQWYGDAMLGIHFHQLKFALVGSGVWSIEARMASNDLGPDIATPHEVVITDCDFGTPGELMMCGARVLGGKSFRARANRFVGVEFGLSAPGTRCIEFGRNHMRDSDSDMLIANTFALERPRKGSYVDDHVYPWIYDNTFRLQNDNYSGYTSDNEPHADFIQQQQGVLQWTQGRNYALINGTGAVWCMASGNYYFTNTPGVAGVTIPSHMSGTASDGGINWTFHSTIANGPMLIGSMHGNRVHVGGDTFADLDDASTPNTAGGKLLKSAVQFWIDSMRGAGSSWIVFDNIAASSSDKGFFSNGTPGEHRLEHNIFASGNRGPVIADPSPIANAAAILDAHCTGTNVYSRRNIAGQYGAGVHEDDLVVRFKAGQPDPATFLRGTFAPNPHASNDTWEYRTFDDGMADPAAFVEALESFLLARPAYAGFGALPSYLEAATFTLSFRLTGGDGGFADIARTVTVAAA